ncbi:dihydrofolate reductase family protein [Roseobacter sinensis]|uniref:Dihydrofolate reductase family protein n=1 Tax=Roseobacter sinensis TaxID=2931391 RepID=A0ABT3BE57_9RHOB|nr:dihydrofolate reductase family protein [Roseobacter sp. WL0113]MCV3271832.1 dihydrofolate reductase family protein [Roseobacter sp. WL0113]
MAKFVFGMNLSLDGYVDHEAFEPGTALFRYFIAQTERVSGSLYGRRMYEVMRYWDEDDPSWSDDFCNFADAWRRQPKWVASRTLRSVGPNATLVEDDLGSFAKNLKGAVSGEIQVAGPDVAHHLGQLGLVDEYQLFLRPVVLGAGKPFFKGARPKLQFVGSDRIGEDAVRLTYANPDPEPFAE